MELESYFEFLTEDAIRLAGTHVGIETVFCSMNMSTVRSSANCAGYTVRWKGCDHLSLVDDSS